MSGVVIKEIFRASFTNARLVTRRAEALAVMGWLASIVALLVVVVVPVVAQQQREVETGDARQVESERERRQPEGGRRGDGLMERLNLSPEQRAQIRTIRQQTHAEGRLITQRVRQSRRALDEAIYSDDADESVIEARARDLAAAQADGVRLRALTELRIRRLLTPEQLGTLREIRRQATDRQQERRTRIDERRMRRGGANRPQSPDPDSSADTPNSPPPAARSPRPRRNIQSKPQP